MPIKNKFDNGFGYYPEIPDFYGFDFAGSLNYRNTRDCNGFREQAGHSDGSGYYEFVGKDGDDSGRGFDGYDHGDGHGHPDGEGSGRGFGHGSLY